MEATLQHLRDKYIQFVRDSSCEYLEDFEFGSEEEMVDWLVAMRRFAQAGDTVDSEDGTGS